MENEGENGVKRGKKCVLWGVLVCFVVVGKSVFYGHFVSFYVILYHFMSLLYHIISYYIILYHFFSTFPLSPPPH